MNALVSILACHHCFKGLEQRYIDMIAKKASNVSFNQGDVIFQESDKAENFYIIQEGIVALQARLDPDRDPITIQMIGEDDTLGWSWLFPPYTWHFDARAVAPIKAISLDGVFIRAKCEEDHDLGYELLKRFAHIIQQRLQAVRLQNPKMYVVKTDE